ncbi:MAG: hypothetical protein ACXVKC_09280 [Candidatus Angelobacter sp.]
MRYETTVTEGAWPRIPSMCFVLAIAALVMVLGETAEAANPTLCFTQVTGLPKSDGGGGWTFPNNPPNVLTLGDETNHPVDPDIDTGWFNAFRLPFENGTPHPDGAMQAIAQGSMMYFSFKVKNDTDFDISDAVVLGFSSLPPETQNSPQTYTWIVIQPFALGLPTATAQAVPSTNIKVWKGTNGGGGVVWGSSFSTVNPWITAVLAGSGNQWYVNVRVDNSAADGPGLPMAGKFGLILDAVATSTDGSDRQFLYPSGLPALNDTLNADAGVGINPAPTSWADATFAGGCAGIHFDHGDIRNTVNGSPSSVISASAAQANSFSVKVHNSGADAPSVRATFKIANFGLPAPQEWALIGSQPNNDNVTPNPTLPLDIPAHTVPPGSCGDGTGDGCNTITAPSWTLGASNAAYYLQPAHKHECVRVDLEALTGDPTFMNSSSWNNFDFAATASTFVSPPAFVSAKYPAAKGAAPGAPQVFDLVVTLEKVNAGGNQAGATRSLAAGQGASTVGKGGGDRIASVANLVVHACRRTGTFVTIDPPVGAPGNPQPQKFENCETVGAYGYGITHLGQVAIQNWKYKLEGSGLSQVRPGVYRLVVPQDGVAQIVTTVEPEEPGLQLGKFAVFADLGVAIPHGTLGNVANPGVSFNAGLEYILKPNFSAEGILGVQHFSGKIGGDTTAIQFTGGGKFYFMPGPNRPFVRAGLGGYHFTSGTTNFGGYFGGGWLHEFNAHFGVDGVYTFHTVNTPGTAAKFSTIQGGVRYAF